MFKSLSLLIVAASAISIRQSADPMPVTDDNVTAEATPAANVTAEATPAAAEDNSIATEIISQLDGDASGTISEAEFKSFINSAFEEYHHVMSDSEW